MKTPPRHPLSISGISQLPAFRYSLVAAAILLLLLSARSTTFAGSATWDSIPRSGGWNVNNNWTPNTGYPGVTGISDVATFGSSSITNVSITANTEVAAIVFTGASAFTITASPFFTLTISGNGITNNSRITQNFVNSFSKDTN